MTADPQFGRALELLSRGHALYSGDRIEPGPIATADRLHDRAGRSGRATAGPGTDPVAAASRRLADGLRRTATADAGLIDLVNAAHTDADIGRGRTRAVLDDAHADRAPAADTPMGRREALRRMANRLQTQHRTISRSRRRSTILQRRMHRLVYPHRRTAPSTVSAARAIPLNAVRYHRPASGGHIRQRIAAALDRLGIADPRARRNWTSGYQTLIARESGYRPAAVGSEPATAPGENQPDGHGLGYARGLTQTIPATFARYHQPGTSRNIYDPVANICASMNYVMHHYGVSADGANLAALVQQADPRRPPKGY